MASFPLPTKLWAHRMKEQVRIAAYLQDHTKDLESLIRKGSEGIPAILSSELRRHFSEKGVDLESLPLEKKSLAGAMWSVLGHKYGFEEALNRGVYAPWPHELTSVTCASQALVNFAVAQELDLNPLLIEVAGFRKEGGNFSAGHSFTLVDVGDEQYWIVDQSYHLLGPVSIADGIISVRDEVTGGKEKRFEYTFFDTFDAEVYTERMNYQRSSEGAASMLIDGQRAGIPKIDCWKSVEPKRVEWYIRYDKTERRILSLLQIDRPFVQNRGLKSYIQLDERGDVQDEKVIGYFYRAASWSDFLGKTPLVTIPVNLIPRLIEGVGGLSVDEQGAFERKLMDLVSSDSLDDRSITTVEAIRRSLDDLSKTRFGKAARKIALVEALYQNERNGDYVFPASIRDLTLRELGFSNPAAEHLRRVRKYDQKALKYMRRIDEKTRIERDQRFLQEQLLDPERREDPEIQRYLSIQDPLARLKYMMENEPKFTEEAIDRVAFVQRRLDSHLRKGHLEVYAQEVFRGDLDKAVLRGYARIFAEFLGHIANGWNELKFGDYKKNLIKNVRNYRK